jgi:hypothetical protein
LASTRGGVRVPAHRHALRIYNDDDNDDGSNANANDDGDGVGVGGGDVKNGRSGAASGKRKRFTCALCARVSTAAYACVKGNECDGDDDDKDDDDDNGVDEYGNDNTAAGANVASAKPFALCARCFARATTPSLSTQKMSALHAARR